MLPSMTHNEHFIGNRWVSTLSGETLPVLNPSNGEIFARIARGNRADIDAAVACARQAFTGPWGRLSALERGRMLARWGEAIRANQDDLANIESNDTGKPLKQARVDVVALARCVEFYGGAAETLHGQTLPSQEGDTVLTIREPHGVTAHIIAWNDPMQIFGRSVGAALAAGNACVVTPSENGCLSLLRVVALAAEVGFPAGALNIVTGLGAEAGQALAEHPDIDHISFTGSPDTGKRVAMAGASHHCPVTLELSGKSPQLVFADADLDAVMPMLVGAIIQNAGQTLSAGSRVLIERSIYEPLLERLAQRFVQLRAGPADLDLGLDLGPLVSRTQQQRVWDFLSDAQADGIAIMAQGEVIDEAPAKGYFQAPVLFRDVPPASRLWRDEVFGPVLSAAAFDSEDEAVALANGTPYGLVASVWTRDGARQLRLARRLEAGQIFINHDGTGGGVELPSGGVRHSGHGREKGFEALYGFTRIKTVAMRHG
jgi:aldehyde dehydrogenase (NAD+)